MTLPLVLLLLDVYPLGRVSLGWGTWRDAQTRARLLEKLAYVALGIAGAAVSYWSVAANNFLTTSDKYAWPARVGIAAYSVWFYVEKTVVPLALSPMYELPRTVSLLEPRFLGSAAAVAAISVALLALHRRWPAGLAVWLYYGIVIGPVAGLVHSGHQITNDRYSYLSCLGWALLLGAAVGSIAAAAAAGIIRPFITRLAAIVAVGWILALAVLTWYQIQIWQDTETLWRYAVESDSRCSICQNNVGVYYYRQRLYPLAKEKYDLALALRPDRMRVHGNLGLALHGMGDVDGAVRHISLALDASPKDPKNLTSMAYVLLTQKRVAEAMPYLEGAYAASPTYVPALVNLGLAVSESGRPREGLPYLLRAFEIKPDESMVRVGLARVYLALAEYAAAREEYDVLTTLDPAAARALEPAFFAVW